MKKPLCLILTFIITSIESVFAQISFDPGEIVDSAGNHISCLIRNSGKLKNPVSFEFKLSENSPIQKANAFNVKEIRIKKQICFVAFDVLIDRSSEYLKTFGYDKDPIWSKERLFLKVLVDGEAKLYYYEDAVNQRFFYSLNDSVPQQLIYKQYFTDISRKLTNENNRFRQQLWMMNCTGLKREILENMDYNTQDLVSYFLNYNKCRKSPVTNYFKMREKPEIGLGISSGLSHSHLRLIPFTWPGGADFETKKSVILSLEAEYFLPLNRKKFSIYLSPVYQSYQSEAKNDLYRFEASLRMIEFAMGLKYNMYLKPKLRVFLNAGIIPDTYVFKESFLKVSTIKFPVESKGQVLFGLGVTYNRFSAEIRIPGSKPLYTSQHRRLLLEYEEYSFLIRWNFL